LFFASLIGSAALIFADDGWRVMHSTWPFVALFISFGFTYPLRSRSAMSREPLISARAGASLITVLIAFIVAAPAVARAWPGAELMRSAQADRRHSGQSGIFEGRSVTGIVVVADDVVVPDSVPGLHASQFVRLAKDLELEQVYGKFVDRAMARLPFALITAARIDVQDDDHQAWNFVLAPPEILTARRQRAWLVEFATPAGKPGEVIVPEISSVQSLSRVTGPRIEAR
jgi:hypothetical protein